MSGHSKWASIKHKKAATDSKRGKLFSKLVKEITVAARTGGGDIDTNPRLRTVIQTARDANMPAENIERAIKKGTGELPGVTYEEFTYEGYGPGGVAILLRILTDNKNRTAAEIRHIFEKRGGNLGGSGSVAWMFDQKGFISVKKTEAEEDALFALVLEAGADDFQAGDDVFEIYSSPADFEAVKKVVQEKGIAIDAAEISQIPKNLVKVEENDARRLLKLLNSLEENDDVQNISANFDIPDRILEEIQSES